MKNAGYTTQAIIRDILRQGKYLLEGKQLRPSDLTTDKLIMLCENDCFNDNKYMDAYYNNEDEILKTLEKWCENNQGRVN